MKYTIRILLIILLMTSCKSSLIQTVTSPDHRFKISYSEDLWDWPRSNELEWTDFFRFKSKGRWYRISSPTLSFNYYSDDAETRSNYEDLLDEVIWDAEWNPGFQPIRIDEIKLSDGLKVYLVYALTYANSVYHDYYYSYTALCVKEGQIWRYPLFEGLKDCKDIHSEILVINPASIDLDFTLRPEYYENGLDRMIVEKWEKDRIRLDSKTEELIIADSLRIPFNGFSFYVISE